MQTKHSEHTRSAGFSLIELMIAMLVTLVVMSIASSLLGQSLNIRARENARVEAVSDTQRALNAMSRDIANAGLGLTSNGIVAADSDDGQIRIRTNLNAFNGDTDTLDSDEDVVYSYTVNSDVDPPETLVTRQDVNTATVAQIANRIDGLNILYFDVSGTQLAAGQENLAAKVRLTLTVQLPAVGSPKMAGYQPATQTQLSSDVMLRNSDLVNY